MRVLVSGASGWIGTPWCRSLANEGHEVVALVRRPARGANEVSWDPAAGRLDPGALEGFDAVVHLAGAGIADARWTAARREEIVASRVRSTDLLARALATLRTRPRVLVSMSATGWYGDRGDEALSESSGPGTGFLAGVARAWEAAAAPAAAAGIRVAHPRLGLVLEATGGALGAMLPIARLGLAGPLGSGRQWWSWVTRADVLRALRFALEHDALAGPFNVVAPDPRRNADFTHALGRALHRPAVLPAPAFALRLAMGRDFADELLLASARVAPAALLAAGFAFRDADLEGALTRTFAPRGRRA